MSEVVVVIPFWNDGATIDETINSVLRQTFKDFQVVIVDNGSDAAQTQVALKQLDKDDRLFYTRIDYNSGPSFARNEGIALTDSEYIVPLDADNIIVPNALSVWLNNIKPNTFAYSWCKVFNATTQWDRQVPEYDLRKLFYSGNYIDTCAMFRRADFNKTGGYDPQIWFSEDLDLWLNMATHGITGHLIKQYLFYYRVRPGSLVHRFTGPQMAEIYDKMRAKYPQLERALNESKTVDPARRS